MTLIVLAFSKQSKLFMIDGLIDRLDKLTMLAIRRSQGFSKNFHGTYIDYRAHRAVIFAIAQLSCFIH